METTVVQKRKRIGTGTGVVLAIIGILGIIIFSIYRDKEPEGSSKITTFDTLLGLSVVVIVAGLLLSWYYCSKKT
jgi:predicted benzoate:H+ symporter BenE